MSNVSNSKWVEKYRPKKIDEYIFQDPSQKKVFQNIILTGRLPNLLLSGVQGCGKTTLSRLLMYELNVHEDDILIINGSDKTSVEDVRDEIKDFVTTIPYGKFLVVRLEECDYISKSGQAMLRQLMEDYHDTASFILTCNYDHKILPALKSRCQQFTFKSFDKIDILERLVIMLMEEKVRFSEELLERYIDAAYPDIRKIINLLEQNTVNGKLNTPTDDSVSSFKMRVLELLECDRWDEVRLIVCNELDENSLEEMYKILYENLDKSPKFQHRKKWEEGILIISDHLYKHAFVSYPHINAAAMFIRLLNI